MGKENKYSYKKIIMITIFIFAIFWPFSVQALEQSLKEELNLEEDSIYEYYQTLSEQEKQEFGIVPNQYLLNNTLKIESKEVQIENTQNNFFRTREVIPSKYCLADEIKIPAKAQKNLEICWAITALRCLETNLAINGKGYFDFSEMHVDYMTSTLYGGDRDLHSAGNFYYFVDYVNKGLGPIDEEKLPLKTNVSDTQQEESTQIIEEVKNKIQQEGLDEGNVIPRVSNIVSLEFETFDRTAHTEAEITTFQNMMKTFIKKSGALEAYIFSESFEDCYSSKNNAFLSPKTEEPTKGHGVNIVGWDDDFSKENFTGKYQPSQNGAWIVSNSWGEDWGDNGYFYISYEDYFIYRYLTGIQSAEVQFDGLDISIVNLTSDWKDDWKKEKQNILITGISSDSIDMIKVNGVEQQIQNNTANYEIAQTGTYEIEIKDSKGNVLKTQYTVQNMDFEKPKVEISSNVTIPANQDIIVTVDAIDTGGSQLQNYLLIRRSTDIEGIWFPLEANTCYDDTGELFWSEGFQVQEGGNHIIAGTKYIARAEGSFILYVKAVDQAGNESEEKSITITFDKTAPELELIYSSDQAGVVTIQSNEKLQKLEGWILSEDGLSLIKRYTKITQEEITVKDLAGNSENISVNITTEGNVILGDINGDNIVNITDVLIILRHIACVKEEKIKEKHPDWLKTSKELINVDINEDGDINLVDVLRIQRHIVATKSEEIQQKHSDWIFAK